MNKCKFIENRAMFCRDYRIRHNEYLAICKKAINNFCKPRFGRFYPLHFIRKIFPIYFYVKNCYDKTPPSQYAQITSNYGQFFCIFNYTYKR